MTGGGRRWWWRLAGGLLAFGGIEVTVVLIHGQADELRLALVVALVVGACAVLLDVSSVEPAVWTEPAEAEPGLGRLDPRTASHLRILEGHRSAREVDAGLRLRLRELTDQTLRSRHGLALDDPRSRELLGPELQRVLHEAPTRLDADQLDRYLTRIEAL